MARRGRRPQGRVWKAWSPESSLLFFVLALMAWGGNELVGIKKAVAQMQVKQLTYDGTDKVVSKMHDALIRIEETQHKVEEDVKILRNVN